MAIYRITIVLHSKTVSGVREIEQEDVDIAWQIFYATAVDVYTSGKIVDFELVKISIYSYDYKQWKLKQGEATTTRKSFNRKEDKHLRKITMQERAG